MLLVYNSGVRLYFIAVYLASFFNKKARLWITGRKKQALIRLEQSVWFHFASLGEFEQGRPVLEYFRTRFPEKKIVVSFFSPSGYEIRKNTPLADFVCYLPLDTAANAREFIDTIQPELAVFTKYEYWYHFFNEAHQRNIPLHIISGIFRPGQVFFKWYGGLHRRMLCFVSHFFVQDEKSKQLLATLHIDNVTVSGDTRFDRVWANAVQPKAIPVVKDFTTGHKVFIAGSTWPPDEELIASLTTQYPDWKFITAPHEIGEDKIQKLVSLFPSNSSVRYSEIANKTDISSLTSHISYLVIDNIGMLSSLYQYGDIAYIGGGFGAGIHNTLEAAAFGLPVIFGPEYSKFKEAKDLIALEAGFSITNEAGLLSVTNKLINDQTFYNNARRKIKTYVEEHIGATSIIVEHIEDGISKEK